MSEGERHAVIETLRKFESDLQGLMQFLGEKTHLTREEKDEAHRRMKAIKEALNEEYRRGATVSGHEAMNQYEKDYLHPAVHGASTQIRARWNSDPIGSNWFSELYAAHVDIAHALHQIERRQAET